jgi:hypothetical protein
VTQVGTDVVGGWMLAVAAGLTVAVGFGAAHASWGKSGGGSDVDASPIRVGGPQSGEYAYLAGGLAYKGEARDRALWAWTGDILASVGDVTGAAAGVSPTRGRCRRLMASRAVSW